jgi:hypothetical protein
MVRFSLIKRCFYLFCRLNKELSLYKKEAEDQTRKLEKAKADGADAADIRHEVSSVIEGKRFAPNPEC